METSENYGFARYRRSMATSGRPSLADQSAKRVVEKMRELLNSAEFLGNKTKLAKALGISQPSVSNLLLEKNSPAFETAERVAELAKMDVWELLGTKKPAGERVVEYDERYPNLQAAITFARADGIAEKAIERVRSEAYSMNEDPHPRVWLRRIEDEAIAVRREELGLAQDVEREKEARDRDRARVEEMKQVTKPKLPKRKAQS